MILFERQTSDETPRRGIRSYHGYICMCRCAWHSLRGGRLKGKEKGVLVARETHWAGARALPFRAPLAFRLNINCKTSKGDREPRVCIITEGVIKGLMTLIIHKSRCHTQTPYVSKVRSQDWENTYPKDATHAFCVLSSSAVFFVICIPTEH